MRKLLLVTAAAMCVMQASALDFTFQGVNYTVLDETAKTCETKSGVSLTTGSEVSGALVLPANPQDENGVSYTLVRLGKESLKYNTTLESIVIPSTVTLIGQSALSGCSALSLVELPESLTEIGQYAFSNCSSIKEIELPSSLKTIGAYAFQKSGLKSIEIPRGIRLIDKYTFFTCKSLADVKLPETLTEIGNYAFNSCTSLTEITIPNSVTRIGTNAFHSCSALAKVTLGSALQSIGQAAFFKCALTSVAVPPAVHSLYQGAFSGCPLTEVKMGPGIERLYKMVFSDITGIKEVYISAQTAPTATDDDFKSYEGVALYLQGADAQQSYAAATACWNKFTDVRLMTLATDVILDRTNVVVSDGDTFSLTARVEPANASMPEIFWKSTNPAVAYVDNFGNVRVNDAAALSTSPCQIEAFTLYADGPVGVCTLSDQSTGVGAIISDRSLPVDRTLPADIYDISGRLVAHSFDSLAPGIYIARQGEKVEKFSVR